MKQFRILITCLLLCVNVYANAEVVGGSCGDNAQWSLDTETEVLSISGSGDMTNYEMPFMDFLYVAPWYKYCNSIKSVEIGDQITSIGSYAFLGCSSLTSLTIPNSVTSIGEGAFYNCSSLTSVTIGNSVTSIGQYAFGSCSSLKSVTIPNSVTSIGQYAFQSCNNLKNIEINIVDWANKNIIVKTSNLSDKTYSYTHKGIKIEGDYTIPDSLSTIGDYALYYCKDITKLTFPNSITSIGSSAFEGCSNLTSVNVIDLDKWAEIYFGNNEANPLYYAHYLFLNGQLVTEAKLTTAKFIESYTFAYCSCLTSVTIPNSVTWIGVGAFRECSGLTSVTIPNSVTYIGWDAFYECCSLTSVTIPNSVTEIGSSAFSGCSGLTSVTIPNSVTSIEYDTFFGCSSLTSVAIPNSVTSIGDNAFCWCSGLTSVTIGNSVTKIGIGAFSGCDNVKELIYAEGTKKVLRTKLKNINSLIIPKSVTEIDDYAFSDCRGLKSITVNRERPLSIKDNIFYDVVYNSCVLYVPKGTSMMYMSAPVWINFKNIQEIDAPDPTPTIRGDVNGDGVVDVADITEVAKIILTGKAKEEEDLEEEW